jgi:hypothetical protein
MTTATAQAFANIALIKYLLAKLGRTNGKACLSGESIISRCTFSPNLSIFMKSNLITKVSSTAQRG